ncbi:NAD(P)/FAD-dependent oxidoreductase [Nocardioides marinquilinus]|uniref:Pyridine nucleotide-disulfide oxidoreductase domain-containing protein 2 n=1 Tax=Nocardioides marinquilinus TaxID=1210400 RepID=A0ABP9PB98_9ACTN
MVGAGPNGLVAANRLADAGWSVLVLEEQDDVGGAVRSDRGHDPDFVHDTFSAFYPLAVASAALRGLDLERHGLVWEHAPAVLGHPRPDAPWAILHRDRDVTAALFEQQHAGDGEAWHELCRTWDVIGPALIDAVTGPYPPLRAGASMLARLPRVGGLDLVRDLLMPVATLGRDRFGGPGPGLLLAGNAGHADLPIEGAGSGVFGLLLTMLGQTVGYPVPRGGAGELSRALRRRLEAAGGEVATGTAVRRVVVEGGRAVGVVTADGTRLGARRAVLAAVAAPHLFGGLVDEVDLPSSVVRGMRRFDPGPGTVKVDWALDGPVPWAVPPPHAPGTVHVADSVADLTVSLAEVEVGLVPRHPFLLAGQMTTSDPTRSPAGTESLWAYTHVPQPDRLVGDAAADDDPAGGVVRGVWDADDLERFGDRIQARLERLAPGFGSRVRSRRVLGPHELEARNANLIGGALNGGTAQLHQQLLFRPVPALLGRAGTGVRGLFLASASAHPGGGVHGSAGANAARAALWHARLRRR